MKKSFTETRVESNVVLPVTMLENHVNSLNHPEKDFRKKMSTDKNSFSVNYEILDWCSEQFPVEGTVEISFSTDRKNIDKYISIPVTAGFWVVCTKGKQKNYKLTWSSSLS